MCWVESLRVSHALWHRQCATNFPFIQILYSGLWLKKIRSFYSCIWHCPNRSVTCIPCNSSGLSPLHPFPKPPNIRPILLGLSTLTFLFQLKCNYISFPPSLLSPHLPLLMDHFLTSPLSLWGYLTYLPRLLFITTDTLTREWAVCGCLKMRRIPASANMRLPRHGLILRLVFTLLPHLWSLK